MAGSFLCVVDHKQQGATKLLSVPVDTGNGLLACVLILHKGVRTVEHTHRRAHMQLACTLVSVHAHLNVDAKMQTRVWMQMHLLDNEVGHNHYAALIWTNGRNYKI